ncbi:DUF3006 family protein [Natronoarchaeum mannanilyticum]|uniref:Uncharacterized protein n=1 Tax=Natronoarchaeum mannanilyticum TaxID=926360 RepID=A0AAV3TBX0_9EURY
MTILARREFVATIVTLAGTALPFGIGGSDDDQDAGPDDRLDDADAELTGVVDRIERDLAVVLLEREEETVAQRLVQLDRLPASARDDGAVLSVRLSDGDIERLRHDAAATRRRREAARERLNELAEDAS